jgi:hypothetical protein
METNKIVPDWAYEIDVHSKIEYWSSGEDQDYGYPADILLPSIAEQWKDDMSKRCAAKIRQGVASSDDFRWRAPEEFIKTGRWPENVARPQRTNVAEQRTS